MSSRSTSEAGPASPASEALGRLESALGRAPTAAEEALLLWVSPPSAEVRRLAPARALLRADGGGVTHHPGGEVGTIRIGSGAVALAVGSWLHLPGDDEAGAAAALAQAALALTSVRATPLGFQLVVYGAGPRGRASGLLPGALRAISRHGARAGVPLLGASLHLAPEYGEGVIADVIAVGWCPEGTPVADDHAPSTGDVVIEVKGIAPREPRPGAADAASDPSRTLRRILSDLGRDRVSLRALAVGGASPLGPLLETLGSHGLRLEAATDASPAAAIPAPALDPERSLVLVTSADAAIHVEAAAVDRGGTTRGLGRVEEEGSPIRIASRSEPSSADVVALPPEALRVRAASPRERPDPDDGAEAGELHLDQLAEPDDYERALRQLLRSPNLASRRGLHERFDTYAGGATLLHPGCGAGSSVLRLRERGERLAFALGGNPRFSALDPYVGFGIAVGEAIRSLSALGARARALAASARFGRGDDADTTARAEKGLAGLRDAARAFGVPCLALGTGRERPEAAEPAGPPVFPTVSCIGTLDRDPVTAWFKHAGDVLLLLGRSREEIGGSEFAATMHGSTEGNPPWIDFEAERSLQEVLLTASERGLLRSARSLAVGGLAMAVVESCCAGPEGTEALGARVRIDEGMRPDAWLFGESQSRVLVSVRRDGVSAMRELADAASVPFAAIGEVAPSMLECGELISLELEELQRTWRDALGEALGAG